MLENLTCPECGGPMTSRKNRSTCQRFWGCNAYPDCRGTRDTDGEAPKKITPDEPDLPSDRARHNDRSRWRTQS